LYVKLVPHAEEIREEYQGGSPKGRSTADQTFTMRQILEKMLGTEYRCTSITY